MAGTSVTPITLVSEGPNQFILTTLVVGKYSCPPLTAMEIGCTKINGCAKVMLEVHGTVLT